MDFTTDRQFFRISQEIEKELQEATSKFGQFASAHEGYAVIKEEVDELWDAVKDKNQGYEHQRNECIQIAAMAIRFITDICEFNGAYGTTPIKK